MELTAQQQAENLIAVIFGGAERGPHRAGDESRATRPQTAAVPGAAADAPATPGDAADPGAGGWGR